MKREHVESEHTERMRTEQSPEQSASPQAAPAGRRLLLVIVCAVFLTTFTGSMINAVIPVIRAELGASPAWIGWVVTGYLLAYAVAVPILGRASDRHGVRRLFAIGLAGFAAGGVVCALAPNLPVLILGRTLQGCAGAAVPALSAVAVARTFPPGRRGGALGMIASTVGIGQSVGPVAGGALGEWLGWRGIFGIPIALALFLIPFALRFLPDQRSPEARSFDAAGGLLLASSAGLLLFSITQGQAVGFSAPSSWGSLAVAFLAAAALVRRSKRVTHPFLPLGLFRNRGYVTALLVGPAAMFVSLSVLVLVPLLVVEVNGLSSAATGMVLTPQAVAVALTAPFAGRLSDRVGTRRPIRIGLGVMMLTVAALSVWAGLSPLAVAAMMAVLGAGLACVQSPTSNAAANALDEKDVGAGMGLIQGTGFLLGAAGPAVAGALLAARQRIGSEAWNPLFRLGHLPDAGPFSDTFLALLIPLAGAFAIAGRLRAVRSRTAEGAREGERSPGMRPSPAAAEPSGERR